MKQMTVKEWFNTNAGYDPYSFQERVINNILVSESDKILLAASPNAGKTTMIICVVSLMLRQNPNLRVLFLTHNTWVLLDNFIDNMESCGNPFDYGVYSNKNRDWSSNIIMTLPASINRSKDLPEFDIVVVDEAHQYYEKSDKNDEGPSMVQKIIDRVNAKKVILMTGSPSSFNGRDEEFHIEYVDFMEVYTSGNCAEVDVEISTSQYFATELDYTKDGEIRDDFVFVNEHTDITLDDVVNQIDQHLINRQSRRRHGRTLIACKSTEQAEQVGRYFTRRGITNYVSTSKTDSKNFYIKDFKKQKDKRVLIVVYRGILGFSDKTLVNVVDLTLSRNLDRMFQLFNRATRKWDNTRKLYIKVIPENLTEHFKVVVSAMMCNMGSHWYKNWNGKNFKEGRIPLRVRQTGSEGTSGRGSVSSSTTNRPSTPKLPSDFVEQLEPMDPNEIFQMYKAAYTQKTNPNQTVVMNEEGEVISITPTENLTIETTEDNFTIVNPVFQTVYWTDINTFIQSMKKHEGGNFMNTDEMIIKFYEENAGEYIPNLTKDLTKKSIINRAKRIGIHERLVDKYGLTEFKGKPDGYWKIIENVLELAWTCENWREFKKKSNAAWKTANDNKLLYLPKPEGCGFTKVKEDGYYTPELVMKLNKEAELKGVSLKVIDKKAPSAVLRLKQRGLLPEDFKSYSPRFKKYTPEMIADLKERCEKEGIPFTMMYHNEYQTYRRYKSEGLID